MTAIQKVRVLPYKLIADQTNEGPTRYYNYTVEDPEGNEISGIYILTIEMLPDESDYPTMTFTRRWINKEDELEEETIKNVPVDIQARLTTLPES